MNAEMTNAQMTEDMPMAGDLDSAFWHLSFGHSFGILAFVI
jgi:hypothetical protein